ncbi:metal-binding protein [Nocardia sp. NBC_00511]|uniref:metal-binding protein n=1 Tax=Nocardia sp. NBC_00511 TaxID=2903591 RepID=UPI0030E44546
MPYTLLGPEGPYPSPTRGTFGGHTRLRIYGRLDCPSALRALSKGGYTPHRVFFADEPTAIATGYRPCAVCCRPAYRAWRSTHR